MEKKLRERFATCECVHDSWCWMPSRNANENITKLFGHRHIAYRPDWVAQKTKSFILRSFPIDHSPRRMPAFPFRFCFISILDSVILSFRTIQNEIRNKEMSFHVLQRTLLHSTRHASHTRPASFSRLHYNRIRRFPPRNPINNSFSTFNWIEFAWRALQLRIITIFIWFYLNVTKNCRYSNRITHKMMAEWSLRHMLGFSFISISSLPSWWQLSFAHQPHREHSHDNRVTWILSQNCMTLRRRCRLRVLTFACTCQIQ